MKINTQLNFLYWRVIFFVLFTHPTLAAGNNSASSYTYIWMEAESGAEYNPIVVKSDREASQSIYLASWSWSDAGVITFVVDVPETNNYRIWGRMKGEDIQPYYLSINSTQDGPLWQNLPAKGGDKWFWTDYGQSLDLNAGQNTLRLRQNAGGPTLQLDKILITNDDRFQPQGIDSEEPPNAFNNPYKSSAVKQNGQLSVKANQLVNEDGDPVQLQGISTHGLQWFPIVEANTIPSIAESFGAEVVRLAMYIEDYAPDNPADYWGGYLADPDAMLARTMSAIEDAIDAGIYVMVDWHIHNQPSKFITEALGFYEQISDRYGSYPNIIYEIANEPVGVNWRDDIKPYAEEVIEVIRGNDPDNIILVGTPQWSQDVDEAAKDPLDHDNIMYSLHFYAGTHDFSQMKSKAETALSAGLAIFVSEWGTSDVGTSFSNYPVARQWMDYMNDRGLSWVNWSLGNKDEASSILLPTASLAGPWSDSDLTPSGSWLKPWFDPPESDNDNDNGNNENEKNSAPKANNVSASVKEGQAQSIDLNAHDKDGDIIAWFLDSPPENGSVYIENGSAVYSPNTGFSGVDSFTYYVKDNDNALSSVATVNLNILPGEEPKPNDLDCSIHVDSWHQGYIANFTLTNNGDSTLQSWSVKISLNNNDTIVNHWNADISSDENPIIATNVSYNGKLEPGESATFGFQAAFTDNFKIPGCR